LDQLPGRLALAAPNNDGKNDDRSNAGSDLNRVCAQVNPPLKSQKLLSTGMNSLRPG
jgi:hypothetical protein